MNNTLTIETVTKDNFSYPLIKVNGKELEQVIEANLSLHYDRKPILTITQWSDVDTIKLEDVEINVEYKEKYTKKIDGFLTGLNIFTEFCDFNVIKKEVYIIEWYADNDTPMNILKEVKQLLINLGWRSIEDKDYRWIYEGN